MFEKFKKLNYAQRVFVLKAIGIGFLILALLLMLGISHHHEITAYDNDQQMKKDAQVVSTINTKRQDRVQNSVINKSINSSDPVLRAIGENHAEINRASKPLSKFAKIYYDWNSESKYRARAGKLRGTLAPYLLKRNNLFGSDKNKIRNSALNSVLSDLSISQVSRQGSSVNMLVDAYYTTWSGNPEQSNGGDNKHNGSQWLLVTINTKKQVITNLKMVFLNPNAHQNSSNAGNNSHASGSGIRY